VKPVAAALPLLVTNETELARAVAHLERAACIAFDLEANGLFAYRAKVCIVQLATTDAIFVVDALATSLRPLEPLLRSSDVLKIVHDVAFDARLLAEAGAELANVHDTSIAARMLGRTATGLASLLLSEVGVGIDKSMQQHDWGKRPLDDAALGYLACDVVHLHALESKLWPLLHACHIDDEVEEETRYRLAQAAGSAKMNDGRPPYLRLKGIDRADAADLPILRRLAELREARARELDVPPYKVLGPDVLFAIAQNKPKTPDDLECISGAAAGRARSLTREILRAVEDGVRDGAIPEEDRAMLVRPSLPNAVVRARRARERRLMCWRKDVAKRRAVDDQVVLPGHCLQDLASLSLPSLDAIAAVPGIGRFRVERDGAALLAVLLAEETEG